MIVNRNIKSVDIHRLIGVLALLLENDQDHNLMSNYNSDGESAILTNCENTKMLQVALISRLNDDCVAVKMTDHILLEAYG